MSNSAQSAPGHRSRRSKVVPIESNILILRHQKVILDTTLAELYGIDVKRLNEQVKRNRERFPLISCFKSTPGKTVF